jgi:hypothetical protein
MNILVTVIYCSFEMISYFYFESSVFFKKNWGLYEYSCDRYLL